VAGAPRREAAGGVTITTVGLDADDTLWHNEEGFRGVEARFVELVSPYVSKGRDVLAGLTATEIANLKVYGYGVKAFGLSLIEAALTLTNGELPTSVISTLLGEVRDLLEAPVRLLPGVAEVLDEISGRYRLVLITKGDLIHQTRKITTSGLAHHFDHVEVVNEKDPETYAAILLRLGVEPGEFCMVGNSVRSDVLPPLTIGAQAVHVPYPLTWAFEMVDAVHMQFHELESLAELPAWLAARAG
jgi:putative hydrolase of the HAD superfamily